MNLAHSYSNLFFYNYSFTIILYIKSLLSYISSVICFPFHVESYRLITLMWYLSDRYRLFRKLTPKSSSYILASQEKNKKGARCGPLSSRAATAWYRLLIFISCNIYRGAIAVRRKEVAGSELCDMRW